MKKDTLQDPSKTQNASIQGYIAAGLEKLANHEPDEAIRIFSEATLKSPFDALPYLYRGFTHGELLHIRQAHHDLDMFYKYEKDHGKFFYHMGLIQFRLSNFLFAVGHFSRALKFSEVELNTFSLRALAFMELGDFIAAKSDIDFYLKIDPKNQDVQEIRQTIINTIATKGFVNKQLDFPVEYKKAMEAAAVLYRRKQEMQ